MSTPLFAHASASHPQWREATSRVVAQLRIQLSQPAFVSRPSLGLLYLTDSLSADAADILEQLRTALPTVNDWAGAVGVGVVGQQGMHFDVPAVSVMLLDLPPEAYRLFSGLAPLSILSRVSVPQGQAAEEMLWEPSQALVHADPSMPDLPDLIAELSERTTDGNLCGGLVASRGAVVQVAWSQHQALSPQGDGVLYGGFSGVAFSPQVPLHWSLAHACAPLAPACRVTACQDNVILELDGRPALQVLLETLDVSLEDDMSSALDAVRNTLVAVGSASEWESKAGALRTMHLDETTWIRGIVGLDGSRQGVALTEPLEMHSMLMFCQQDPARARAELVRACADIREALSPSSSEAHDGPLQVRKVQGVVYLSCAARLDGFLGDSQAELQLLRSALGDVPVTGFFAAGEIARQRVHAYCGLVIVFAAPAENAAL